MNDDANNGQNNGGNASKEADRILEEIQMRLDAGDLEQAEFRKMMSRLEFQMVKSRRETDARVDALRESSAKINEYNDKRITYLLEMFGVFGDHVFDMNDKFSEAGDIFSRKTNWGNRSEK